MHLIAKAGLRGSHNSNDRLGESIERLMAAIVKVEAVWDGQPAVERVQLLGGNIETLRADGLFEYEIPARLRKIISNSTIFARLQREVMFALSSKYALTLYEMVQKRGNLRWRSSERFSLEQIRGVLGVPKGRLTSWSNLRLRALDPAVAEVCALSDFMVAIEPIKTGRAVTHVEMRWWRKDGEGEAQAGRALEFASTGPPRPGRGPGRAGRGQAAPRPGSTGSAPACAPKPTRRRGCAFPATTSIMSRANGAPGPRASPPPTIPTAPSCLLPPVRRNPTRSDASDWHKTENRRCCQLATATGRAGEASPHRRRRRS